MELGERIKETVMEHFFPYRLHEYDQAVQAILATIREAMPEEKAVEGLGLGYDEDVVTRRKGFNACRSKVLEILEEKP